MIRDLIDRLCNSLKNSNLGLGPRTLGVKFAQDSLLAHHSRHNLLERSTLRVAPGQIAYLIINGRQTPMSGPGDHQLDPDSIPQAETADILYINLAESATRPWQSQYQPSQRRLNQPLLGSYTLSIENPDTFCRTLIDNQALELDDSYIDQVIGFIIDQILMDEKISADDIDYQTEALQNFLKARLRPHITALGLKLHDLRIARSAVPPHAQSAAPHPATVMPEPTPTYARDLAPPPAAKNTAAKNDEPRAPLGQDKIYYRVHHGQQIGPLSALDIQKLSDEGQILAKDLLWQKGMTAWLPADAFDLFNWD